MNDVPHTARGFRRWYDRSKAEWPVELQKLGERAALSLELLDAIGGDTELIPQTMTAIAADLQAFATAYAAWRG